MADKKIYASGGSLSRFKSWILQYFPTKTEVETDLSSKSDTGHTHDGRYYTESEIDSMLAILDNWPSHNSIYRHENLLDSSHFGSIENLHNAVSAGNFKDIYVGDYLDTIDPSNTSKTVRMMVAGINIDNTEIFSLGNHLALIPELYLDATLQMNSSNTIEGGYYGSAMRQKMDEYGEIFNSNLGGHVPQRMRQISNTTSSTIASGHAPFWKGVSTNVIWNRYTPRCILLSEAQVFGCKNFSSSGFDSMSLNFQLPIFRIRPDIISIPGALFWLRDVGKNEGFCNISQFGDANTSNATEYFRVRPMILFN